MPKLLLAKDYMAMVFMTSRGNFYIIKLDPQMSKWRVSESWTTMRCTIMSNGWINGRSHIKLNFLVSCTYVTIIFKSLDVSSWMKDAQLMFHLLDEMVMGVQVEMLCRASLIMPLVVFLLVGSWRKNTQPYSRLHPLLRISKLEWVKKLVDHDKCITKYIYNHTWLLNLMRKKHRGKGAY